MKYGIHEIDLFFVFKSTNAPLAHSPETTEMRNLTVNKRVLLWVGCVAGVLGIAGTCWLCYVIVTVNSRAHMAKPGEVLFEVAGFATALCLIISIAVGICDLLGTEPVSYRWEINRGTTVRTSTAGDPQRGRFVTIDDD